MIQSLTERFVTVHNCATVYLLTKYISCTFIHVQQNIQHSDHNLQTFNRNVTITAECRYKSYL